MSTKNIHNRGTNKFLFHGYFFKGNNSGEILHRSVFNRSLNHTSICRLRWSNVITLRCKIKYPGLLADKVSVNGFTSIAHVVLSLELYFLLSDIMIPYNFKKVTPNFPFLEPTITDNLNYMHLPANAGSSLHFFMRIISLLLMWQRNNCKALLEHLIFTTK